MHPCILHKQQHKPCQDKLTTTHVDLNKIKENSSEHNKITLKSKSNMKQKTSN